MIPTYRAVVALNGAVGQGVGMASPPACQGILDHPQAHGQADYGRMTFWPGIGVV